MTLDCYYDFKKKVSETNMAHQSSTYECIIYAWPKSVQPRSRIGSTSLCLSGSYVCPQDAFFKISFIKHEKTSGVAVTFEDIKMTLETCCFCFIHWEYDRLTESSY